MSNLAFAIGLYAHFILVASLIYMWLDRREPEWSFQVAPWWVAVFVTIYFWVEVLR